MSRPMLGKVFYTSRQSSSDGFMVLLIVIIGGALAAAAASSVLLLSTMGAQTSLSAEQSYSTQSMASACAEAALEQIYNNISYTGTANVTIGANSCSYTVAAGAGQARTVTTTSTINGIKRRVQVNVTQITPVITYSSWTEY